MNEDGNVIEEIGYTTSGNIARAPVMVDVEDPKCYAKKVYVQHPKIPVEKYYVKGTRGGDILNPFDEAEITRRNRIMGTFGQEGWQFVNISEVGFKNYMEFLRSNNSMYYQRAVWELKNGGTN